MKRKKACIVTVYNSINSGSFWQAKALEYYLSENDIEVYFYKRDNKGIRTSSSKVNQFLRKIKLLLNGKFTDIKKLNQSIAFFDKLCSDFKIIKKGDNVYNEIDCFILGSDTIWNVNNSFFLKNYKIYFGGIFEDKKVISYAASVGNTSLEEIKALSGINNYIKRMVKIGVRDNSTLSIMKKISDKEIELVCDPTLLLYKEDYIKLLENKKIIKPKLDYIFTYLFEDINDHQIKQLKEYARKNSLRIISGTKNYDWCDECIVNEPLSFLNYMTYADYIITDTFHGTIFSVNLKKQFSIIERNKNKVNDFLQLIDMSDRKESKESLDKMNSIVDYENNKKLETLRDKSKEFIIKSIIEP